MVSTRRPAAAGLSGARLSVPAGLALVVTVTLAFLVLVRLPPVGSRSGRAVDDLGQLAAALLAAASAGWRGRRSASRRAGLPWLLLALACSTWAAGQVVWTWRELVGDHAMLFPGPPDLGFLLFPVLAGAALLCWPSPALGTAARWRALLDGVLVAGALFLVSWVGALRVVVQGDDAGARAHAVMLAYPVADLVLLTLTVVFVAYRGQAGTASGLGLLALGLACLGASDSAFAYLMTVDRYGTGSVVNVGWVAGFLLIAVAALAAGPPTGDPGRAPLVLEPLGNALLPYAPAVVGLVAATRSQLSARPDRVALAASVCVIAALLVRQLLAVLDNRRLVRQLVEVQQELRHQAFHDPLTGLANRALFADRLRHGLDLHRRDLRPLSLLYCDLDGFKQINDALGHDAGDHVLKAAAERLRAVTRPGDTVARMGGDEFAVLLEDGTDATTAAARILDAFSQSAAVGRHRVPLAASIGIALLAPDEATVEPGVLLQRADSAMYLAKRRGKGSAVQWRAGDPELPAQRVLG